MTDTSKKKTIETEAPKYKFMSEYKKMKKADLIEEIFSIHEKVFKAFRSFRNDLMLLEEANRERKVLWRLIQDIEYEVQRTKEPEMEFTAREAIEKIDARIIEVSKECNLKGDI